MKKAAYRLKTSKQMLDYSTRNDFGPFAGKNKRRITLEDVRRACIAPAKKKEEENG